MKARLTVQSEMLFVEFTRKLEKSQGRKLKGAFELGL
jgi:hypothetical protein